MNPLVKKLKDSNPDLRVSEIEMLLIQSKPFITDETTVISKLIAVTGLPRETLKKFVNSLRSILGDSGLDEYDSASEFNWTIKSYDEKSLAQILASYRSEINSSPERDYDQFYALPETTISKVKILNDKGLIAGQDILLIGDDDLVSLAIGLVNPNYKSITVLDIDKNLLEGIDRLSAEHSMANIKTYYYDARNDPLPNLIGKFDVCITDPPYTRNGVNLFLRRCMQYLGPSKDYSGKYIFLYYGNSFKSPEKFIKIQDVINSFNLVIEDKLNNFAHYKGADSIGSSSSLYILKSTPQSSIPSQNIVIGNIYTFEAEKEEKFPYVDHFVIKVKGVSEQTINSKTALQHRLNLFCKKHKLHVVDTKITEFSNGGITLTYVLSTSNLVVHTWPEYQALHIDLVTCSPIHRKELLGQTISELFSTQSIEVTKVE